MELVVKNHHLFCNFSAIKCRTADNSEISLSHHGFSSFDFLLILYSLRSSETLKGRLKHNEFSFRKNFPFTSVYWNSTQITRSIKTWWKNTSENVISGSPTKPPPTDDIIRHPHNRLLAFDIGLNYRMAFVYRSYLSCNCPIWFWRWPTDSCRNCKLKKKKLVLIT